jgi:hypothetical protein
MTSIIFSDTNPVGSVHLVPKNAQAISYKYTPDRLFLYAHLGDNYATVDQPNMITRNEVSRFYERHCFNCRHENGSRCSEVRNNGYQPGTPCPAGHRIPEVEHLNFQVAPSIFEYGMKLTKNDNGTRFVQSDTRVFLQASMVTNKRIKVGKNKLSTSNVHADTYVVCWGSTEMPNSLRSMVNNFFRSIFNNDLTTLNQFIRNNDAVKADLATDNFFRTYSSYRVISENADAIYVIHSEDNLAAYFWLNAAGFKPIPESNNLMFVPLTETTIDIDGYAYSGYMTEPDKCKKSWFITPDGQLIGQL